MCPPGLMAHTQVPPTERTFSYFYEHNLTVNRRQFSRDSGGGGRLDPVSPQ